ncbi:hypothetical protein HN51_066425 [Arachis hypogaea]
MLPAQTRAFSFDSSPLLISSSRVFTFDSSSFISSSPLRFITALTNVKETVSSLATSSLLYYEASRFPMRQSIDPLQASRAIELKNHSLLYGKVIRVMWSRRDPDVRKSGRGNVFVKNLAESIDNAGLHDLFQKFGNILSSFGNCFGASNWFRGSDDSDTAEKPRERGALEKAIQLA